MSKILLIDGHSIIHRAFYGVPDELKTECRKRLRQDLLAVLDRFATGTLKNK